MSEDNKKKALIHCIYVSAETEEFSEEDIADLLEKARANNSKLDVTGMLLYEDKSFFQVLEGEPKVVTALFEKIKGDKRHSRVAKIIEEKIEQRNFSE